MRASPTTDSGVVALDRAARPVTGAPNDYDALLDQAAVTAA